MEKPSATDRVRRSRNDLAEITGSFLRSLSQPSDGRPTVRCVSRADVLRLVVALARDASDGAAIRDHSGAELLKLLETSNILQPLALMDAHRGLFLYLLGPQNPETVDPIELLEAAHPTGVVCYFTALQYYGLTTQSPSHHHIAKIVQRPLPKLRELNAPNSTLPRKARDPLGMHLFTYQNLRYYQTTRGAHTIAGVQLRQINDKSIVRITSKEQTLLDTLQRPVSCGGPSVVWEAWAQGLPDLNEELLAQHLKTIGDSKLIRRVGYMLDVNDHTPDMQLAELLQAARLELTTGVSAPILLLPGLPCAGIDPTWKVKIPSS